MALCDLPTDTRAMYMERSLRTPATVAVAMAAPADVDDDDDEDEDDNGDGHDGGDCDD